MTRDDIRKLMPDYFDGYLSNEEKKRVQSFLEEYDDVAEEYRKFDTFLHKLENLTTGIEVPDNLMRSMSEELLSLSFEQYENKKQKKLREISEGKKQKEVVEKDSSENKKINRMKSINILPAVSLTPGRALLILFILFLIIAAAYFAYDYIVNFLKVILAW